MFPTSSTLPETTNVFEVVPAPLGVVFSGAVTVTLEPPVSVAPLQLATPEPPSVHVTLDWADAYAAKLAPEVGLLTVTTGAFSSTLLPPMLPKLAQFEA